jgi:phosphatidylglycerol:prolipoprotein diacylglycerol transferase
MRRVLFEVPGLGLKVFGFGAMIVMAVYAAVSLTAWRARREKLDPQAVYDLAVWLLLGGVIGARLFFVLQHRETIDSVWDVFKIWQGGIVFYGCILGGLIGSTLYWLRHPFPFRPMADAVAPALAIGLALGRIGCFLNGCCYGDTCDPVQIPWAGRFPAESPPWVDHVRQGLIAPYATSSLPVHPTQLYSALDGLILLGLLSAFFPLRRKDGEVMALLMVTYPISRFLIEYLRDDEAVFFAGMTISQSISVLVFAAGLLVWAYLWRLPAGRYADTADRQAVNSAIAS